MVKNKVILKERDAWSDLANFIVEMVAKYAEAYNKVQKYKISIERKVAA